MTGVGPNVVWELRRDNERTRLHTSLEMANTISAVGEAAGLRSPAVTGVVNDIRDDALQRRQLLDRLSPAGLGSLAWRRLRTETTKSTMLQSGHVGLLKGVTLRGVPSIRAGAIAGDRYLVELGELCKVPWDGVVLPGLSDEHERQHGSVQFAFASSSFWDLPILAHEFGHVVEGRRRTTALDGIEQVLDLQQLLKRAAVEHGRHESIVREYFSDAFAVFVAGPAYVCALILLRLDPTADARLDRGTHPSDGRRAMLALETLRRLDEATNDPFGGFADTLSATWASMVDASRRSLTADDDRDLGLLDMLWPSLESFAVARFTSDRQQCSAALEAQLKSAPLSSPTAIGDFLTAAWVFRLRQLLAGGDVEDSLGDELLGYLANAPSVSGGR